MNEEKKEKGSDLYQLSLTGRQLGVSLSALVLIFCLAFVLGYIVGGAGRETLDSRGEEVKELVMSPPAEGNGPLKEEPGKPETPSREELTFYKTLLEEEPAPGVEHKAEGPEEEAVPSEAAPRETEKPEKKAPPKVEPKPSPPKVASAAPEPKGDRVDGPFTVQVSSLRSLSKAEALRARLERRGYEAYIEKVNLGERGIFHRVRVGSYKTREGALRAIRRLKERENIGEAIVARR